MRGKMFEFTNEQIEYIKENWGKESAHSMKTRFGCSWYAVTNKAVELGFSPPENERWTEKEIEELQQLSKKYHYKEIAKKMGKTENSIYLKARRLGISLIQDRREWTEEEEELLKNDWGKKSIELIAKTLKRSIFSVKVKATRMQLGPLILGDAEKISISDLSETIGISRDRIVKTWMRDGLKVRYYKATKNQKYMYVVLEDVWEFLESHQDVWDSRKLEPYALGYEPSWLQEKRKSDRLMPVYEYNEWTVEEENKAVRLLEIGKDYDFISNQLGRSKCSVEWKLRDIAGSYQLVQFWKGKEIKYLREHYLTQTYREIAEHLGRTEKAVAAKAREENFQKKKVIKNLKNEVNQSSENLN